MNRLISPNRSLVVNRGIVAVTAVTIAAPLAFGGIAAAGTHHYPNSPDSFLKYQVDSTGELVSAIRADLPLRRRYARHFGIPENEVIDFVKSALVPYELPEDRNVTVYGVTKSGRIYGVRTKMRKGTKVWANRSGVPILKWLCANPLTKTLPGTKIAKARSTRVKPKTLAAGGHGPALVAADTEIPTETAPLFALPPVTTTAFTTPSIPGVLGPPAMLSPLTSAPRGNNSLLFPIGLILLSSLKGSLGGSGSGNSSSPNGPPRTPKIPIVTAAPETALVTAAPEPGSLALLLPILGAVAIGIRRRRR